MVQPGARTADAHLRLTPQAALVRLAPFVLELESKAQGRVAIGLAGGPGSGKSTLAAELVAMLNHDDPARAALVPMDGFHIKHARLEALGHTDRKGALHTFEASDFVRFLRRIRSATVPVSGPLYSRDTVSFVNH
ncbi:hypothetical protein [Luteimonas sp. 100069]|uniref:hypothetical protein n=1 Tax=Luteimonas sp. 100069 TaxID=2006109 RepID=UPI000F4F5C79|nr:hypothetical protein [Luteimonas sp. 100069]RPD87641.1 hypothetical protein EGK76_00010 [Luteimonas sp. 100069]